jgi:C4-dicarboxylate-specific signal transduction histidine kinase
VFDFVVFTERARLREDCWPAVLRGDRWIGELHFRHFATGEIVPFLVDAFRIDNPRNGRPMNVATVSRDLRLQKQAEFDLRRLNESLERRVDRRTVELADANRRLIGEMQERERADARSQELQAELSHAARLSAGGQMAAALAHELSQPLAAVTNSANAVRRLLAETRPDKIGTVGEIMSEISEQSLRAGQIIRRLRDFVTRGESEKQVENIRTIIGEANAFARTGLDTGGVRVRFKFDSDATDVLVNRIQIQQVLVNLIRNALEAMAGQQRATLDVETNRLNEQSVEIVVFDTGPGLASEVASQLFEPFISTKREGMGLGLSICRSIVEAHGGLLRHEPNPSGGAIFRFTLPIATPLEQGHV